MTVIKKRERLFRLRMEHGLTHKELAKKAGISRSYYGFIEQGIRNPTFEKAQSIANVFHMTVEEVFKEEFFFAGRCYVKKQKSKPA